MRYAAAIDKGIQSSSRLPFFVFLFSSLILSACSSSASSNTSTSTPADKPSQVLAGNSGGGTALFDKANKINVGQEYFDLAKLPQESLVPGGIALIPFKYISSKKNTSESNSSPLPKVTFQKNRVLVVQTSQHDWIAVVGLSLRLTPGKYALTIHHEQADQDERRVESVSFNIQHKEYEAQYITLKNKTQVNPNKPALDRIRKESRAMKTVFSSWSENAPSSIAMHSFPTEGPMSSQFGLKRFFNNQARNPHSGIDIAASTGSEIRTPLAGKVAALGNYYFNGNTVLIDHGQGMVTMYCHMDSLAVNLGEKVPENTLLGTVGSTGRATGPHLHWSVNLNNTRIEPLLFMNAVKQEN